MEIRLRDRAITEALLVNFDPKKKKSAEKSIQSVKNRGAINAYTSFFVCFSTGLGFNF